MTTPGAAIPRIGRDAAANLFGSLWAAALNVAAFPFYLRVLGPEGVGLINFQSTLCVALTVLDLGFTHTLNRELARQNSGRDAGDLVRTLELASCLIGGLVGGVLAIASPWIARSWLSASTYDASSLTTILVVMALPVAAQLPMGLYAGGLGGLRRHIANVTIRAIAGTVRIGGGIALIIAVAPRLELLFLWHAVVYLIQLHVSRRVLLGALPRDPGVSARVRLQLVGKALSGFAGGMTALTAVALAANYADKLVLSMMLPLQTYAYYTLCGIVAGSLTTLATPIFASAFPSLSGAVARQDDRELATIFRRSVRYLTSAAAPLGVAIGLAPEAVLFAWTGSAATPEFGPVLRVLVVGSAINAVMHVPFALILACGWTWLWTGVTLATVSAFVPCLLFLVPRYGPYWAAALWTLLNLVNATVIISLMHRNVLRGRAMTWVARDVLLPAASAAGAAAAVLALLPPATSRTRAAGVFAALVVAGGIAVAAYSREVRAFLRARLR